MVVVAVAGVVVLVAGRRGFVEEFFDFLWRFRRPEIGLKIPHPGRVERPEFAIRQRSQKEIVRVSFWQVSKKEPSKRFFRGGGGAGVCITVNHELCLDALGDWMYSYLLRIAEVVWCEHSQGILTEFAHDLGTPKPRQIDFNSLASIPSAFCTVRIFNLCYPCIFKYVFNTKVGAISCYFHRFDVLECLVQSYAPRRRHVAVLQWWEDHQQNPASTKPCNTIGTLLILPMFSRRTTISDSTSYHISCVLCHIYLHL